MARTDLEEDLESARLDDRVVDDATVDEEEARRAIEGLQFMGQAYTDEMDALAASQIELDVPEEVRARAQ